jgi:hypothetical protein
LRSDAAPGTRREEARQELLPKSQRQEPENESEHSDNASHLDLSARLFSVAASSAPQWLTSLIKGSDALPSARVI